MWPFDRPTARRSEIRRTRAERVGTWYSNLIESIEPGWAAVMVLTAVAVSLILTAGGPRFALREGQSSVRAITSRVNFKIEDQQKTSEMRTQARDRSPSHYELEPLLDEIRGRLTTAISVARANRDDTAKVRDECAKNKVLLKDDAAVAELLRLAGSEDAVEYARMVDTVETTLKSRALVEPEATSVRRTSERAVLHDPGGDAEREVEIRQLTFVNNRESVERLLEDAVRAFPPGLRASMQNSLLAMLSNASGTEVRPLYRYDNERTNEAGLTAAAGVPIQYHEYVVNEILADAGALTADEIKVLRCEHEQYLAERLAGRSAWQILPETAGRSVLACLVVFGILLYVARYQDVGRVSPFRRAATALVLLTIFGLARWTFVSADAPAHAAVGAQALAAAMLAIVYRPGVVFALSAALAVLVSLAVQQGMGFFIILLATSGMFVFGLREVRNRGKIVLVGSTAAVLAAGTSLCLGLVDGETLRFSLFQALWAGAATLLAAFVVEGVLPGIERVFRLSTGMTLLEWCDANKPLMRMMATDAPGTYNHSLLVGALAEAAAETIDADGLLARAGAYYHDIGKINKPDYFVENQSPGQPSRHDRLTPAMSVLIIINHVKDGIEMASEYGLPEALRPFIAEHHGTTLVEYFYHAANRQRRPDDREIADSSYRYPGPKPQSRETAIVMLADGVEGAVRAMSEPTPGRIEDVVSEIVQKRLMDGQFDECDLTFLELAAIQKSLVKTLSGIYHARIVYPESDESEHDERGSTARSAS
jgi:putative nucleotidyltransferase with HDIG domain